MKLLASKRLLIIAWIVATTASARATGSNPATNADAPPKDLLAAKATLRPLGEPEAVTTTASPTNLPTPAIPFRGTQPVEPSFVESEMAEGVLKRLKGDLEAARNLRAKREVKAAIPLLAKLVTDNTPESIQKEALLELGYGAQDDNDLARAQTIFSQFISRWPSDIRTPEVLLRQGEVFRQMGLNNLALAKFYAVMTAALALKSDQLEFYKQLVLRAQTEIAESNFQLGKYAEAADFFSRLLNQSEPGLDRAYIQYRLIRSRSAVGPHDETVAQAQDFLGRYPEVPQAAEVRFLLAQALQKLSRSNEAMQQVLVLLREQKGRTNTAPEVWAYWQQRGGNEIANQLYREGDYTKALDVYLSLADLDQSPAWQLPVLYQVGMTFERLMQPQKAVETYGRILARETEIGTNATPGLKAVIDMAKWRGDFLKWHGNAETAQRNIANPPPPEALITNTVPGTTKAARL